MLHAKLEPKTLEVLKEKIQMIKTDEGAIYLVGPIKLPVNLYGETVVFQWYSWLSQCQVTENYQEIIDKLSSKTWPSTNSQAYLSMEILRTQKMR